MKTYMKPITEIINCVSTITPLASTSMQLKGYRYFRWGNGKDPYGNESWVNEGYNPTNIVLGGDNEGTIDSRSKGGLWADDEDN